MSHTFYDSPESNTENPISIDVTLDYVWFFQHGEEGGMCDPDEPIPSVRVPRRELPAIHRAMGKFLKTERR